jgi:hypothetical protein
MVPLVIAMAVRFLPWVYYICDAKVICITARLVFDLALDNAIHVAVFSHPSLLKHEDLDVRYP